METYRRRLIGYFVLVVLFSMLIGAGVLNKPYSALRWRRTQIADNSTQTQIILMTLSAPTNTPGPTLTDTPLPTVTNTPLLPTLTSIPPCAEVASSEFFIFSEPSLAMPEIKVEDGKSLSLLGRLEGEPWWRVLDSSTQMEGWVSSSDISTSCSLSDRQMDYWLDQKNIIYDTFRGLYPWTGGKTEITFDNRMKFFYTQNANNLVEYPRLIELGVNTEIRTSFTIDLDKIKSFGLRDRDSFVTIKLTDTANNSVTEFKLYFDCSYSPNADNIRPRLLQTCEKRKDHFILISLRSGDVQVSVNGESVPLYSTPPSFGDKGISVELGAYPEAYFDYIFVTSK